MKKILLLIIITTTTLLFSCNCPTCPKDKPPHVIYDNKLPEGVIVNTEWHNEDYIISVSMGATVTKATLNQSMRYDVNVYDTIKHLDE